MRDYQHRARFLPDYKSRPIPVRPRHCARVRLRRAPGRSGSPCSRSTSAGTCSGVSSAGNLRRHSPPPARARHPGSPPPAPARRTPARTAAPPGARLLQAPAALHALRNFPLQAGHRLVRNAAGIDQLKVAQVRRHVEREPMRSDAARHMNPDCADLALFGSADAWSTVSPSSDATAPHAGQPAIRPARTPYTPHSRISASSIMRTKSTGPSRPPFAFTQAAQIEDGITHKLPRPVIGHIAAAIDLVQGHAARGQQLIRSQNVGAPRVAAQRQHRRMLQQQQHVFDAALRARSAAISACSRSPSSYATRPR